MKAAAEELYLKEYSVKHTARIPDPMAFAPTSEDGGVLRLAKKDLDGVCWQRLYIDRVLDVVKAGMPLCDHESVSSEFFLDMPEVLVRAWSPQPGDLLLGRITNRVPGVVFFAGEAPTKFVAQLMEPEDGSGGLPANVADACPTEALVPLQIQAFSCRPGHRGGATGLVNLWGREPSFKVLVHGALTPGACGQLAPLCRRVLDFKPSGPTVGQISEYLGVGPGSGTNWARAVLAAADKGGEPSSLAGGWAYSPNTGAALERAEAPEGTPLPRVSADAFAEFVVRRALGYRVTIARLAEEYPTEAKLATVSVLWRTMQRAA